MFLITCGLAHALCAVQFFFFSFSFSFFAPACCNTPAWKICLIGQRSVGGACKTLRNERFAPCAKRSRKLRTRVKKKPFSTFLLGSLFFSYFSTKLGAFALRATARCACIARGSIRASARAMRDFIIPQFFIHLFFNIYPLNKHLLKTRQIRQD